MRRARSQNHRAGGGRVQRLEIFQRHLGQFRRQRHVDVVFEGDRLEKRVIPDQGQFRVERLRHGDDVLDRLQFGHVKPRFHRHGEVGVTGGLPSAFVFRDGASHAAFAPVVGRQCQMPVAKHAVEFLQVIQRRPGGRQHVAAVVAESALLQLKMFAGGRHELPHASRFGAGNRLRVESAFHERQQRQLRRHIAQLELFNDVEKVFARALRHAEYIVRARGVPLLAVMHQVALQIGHGVTAADAFPQIGGR